jgi:sulfite reductase (ferredoxin)
MGAHSRLADLLLAWAPVADVIRIAEAGRRLFDQFGDRRNKHRARLRFVFEEMGLEAFRTHFQGEMVRVGKEGVPAWQGRVTVNPGRSSAHSGPPPMQRNCGTRYLPQRQDGFVAVPLQLPLGFVPAEDLARLGELASRFSGERGLRATRRQGLLMRFVDTEDLPALVAELRNLSTDLLSPSPLERFVACAGASTCRLGLCLARNAARACAEQLERCDLAADTLEALEIHINGCPNACGQQPIGPVGFSGVAQRVGGRLLPAYRITLGGRCGAEGARLGLPVGQVPARALPDFASELARDFERGRDDGEGFGTYFDRMGQAHFAGLAERHAEVPSYEDRPDWYRDCGVDEAFSLAGRGAGECGAGVFGLVQEDLRVAGRAKEPFEILLPAARALLITQGVDTQDPDAVFREFERYFVDRGLVSEEFRGLLTRARGYAQGWQDALRGAEDAAGRLLQRVTLLYSTLDANLQFHPPEEHDERVPDGGPSSACSRATEVSGNGLSPPSPSATKGQGIEELDLCGVTCPMNFVKAKLKLETMDLGQALAIVLDDGEPIRNVPASLRAEGQEVEETEDLGHGHWRVVVRKRRG